MQLNLFLEDEKKVSKYKAIDDKYFDFSLFEEVLTVIIERAGTIDDHMFKAGVASCEAAVRRLREEYYNIIKSKWQDLSHIYVK